MFKNLRLALCAVLVALILTSGSALAADGLFDVRVAVESESARVPAEAAGQGMRQVVLRLTGSSRVADSDAVREGLVRSAERYLQQFGYERRDDDESYWLRLRFDGPAVERRLTELEVPYWASGERSRLLVWLAVDRAGSRELAGGDSLLPLQESLRGAGRSQGLSLLFPLMDLEDRQRLNPSDVWGGFRAPIAEASARYGTDVVLVVRLSERGGAWSARWLQFRNGESMEWSSSGSDADEALLSGMEQGALQTAERLARVRSADDRRSVRLAFAGVDSLDDYGYLMRLLRDSRGVEAVHVVSAADAALLLEVLLDRDPGTLLRMLDSNARFEPLGSADEVPPADRGWRLHR